MKNSFNTSKVLYTVFLVAALILIVPAINYVSVAFGWTNPPCSPPGCGGAMFVDDGSVVPANAGNVSIGAATASTTLTVNGQISAVGNRVKDVDDPIDDYDAVNKRYVDAAAGGSPTITVYGVGMPGSSAPATPLPYSFFSAGTGTNWSNCLVGDYENCGGAPFSGGVFGGYPAPGAGVSCPAGYASIFDGYGPYTYLDSKYFYVTSGPTPGDDNPNTAGVGSENQDADPINLPSFHIQARGAWTGVTHSQCGGSYFQVAKTDYSVMTYGQVGGLNGTKTGTGAVAGIVSACVPQFANGSKYYICNTCRICEKQ